MRKLLFLAVCLVAPHHSQAAVAHVKSAQGFCNSGSAAGNMTGTCAGPDASHTFTYTANAANDAVVFAVGCGGTSGESSVTLAASGWTITSLSGVAGSNANGWLASFAAIAPNTSATTFTITYSTNCNNFMNALVDEFSGNDTTGGTTTFDAHNQTNGTGNCSVSVTPGNSNDGIWGACIDSITAVGSGYTKGADDTQQDWSEWKILVGSGAQTVNFTGSGGWAIVAATIKPVGATATCTNSIALLGVGCR